MFSQLYANISLFEIIRRGNLYVLEMCQKNCLVTACIVCLVNFLMNKDHLLI